MKRSKIATAILIGSVIDTILDMAWKIALTALCVHIIMTEVVY